LTVEPPPCHSIIEFTSYHSPPPVSFHLLVTSPPHSIYHFADFHLLSTSHLRFRTSDLRFSKFGLRNHLNDNYGSHPNVASVSGTKSATSGNALALSPGRL